MPSVSTETEEEEVKEEVNLMIENKSLKRKKRRIRLFLSYNFFSDIKINIELLHECSYLRLVLKFIKASKGT